MATNDEILDELKKIREALEPKPAPLPYKPKNLADEFLQFIKKYKILGLATAFILGLALNTLFLSLANDIIVPIIGFFIPDFTTLKDFQLGPFTVGNFIAALINFIIIAFVIFLIVKYATKLGLE